MQTHYTYYSMTIKNLHTYKCIHTSVFLITAIRCLIFRRMYQHIWTHPVPLGLCFSSHAHCASLRQKSELTKISDTDLILTFYFALNHYLFWHMNGNLLWSSLIKPQIICTFQKAEATEQKVVYWACTST